MGTAVFLVLLAFAAHVLLVLHATSVVGAVAYDGAKAVAGADGAGQPEARERAAHDARRHLGRLGAEAELVWSLDEDAVALTVRVPAPGLGRSWFDRDVVRTARVRLERVR